jgi:hypothetical protein
MHSYNIIYILVDIYVEYKKITSLDRQIWGRLCVKSQFKVNDIAITTSNTSSFPTSCSFVV